MANRSEIFMATTNTLKAWFVVIGLDNVYIVLAAMLLSPAVQWLLQCLPQKLPSGIKKKSNQFFCLFSRFRWICFHFCLIFFPARKARRFSQNVIKLMDAEFIFSVILLKLSLFNEACVFSNKKMDQSSSRKSQEKLVCVSLETHMTSQV